MRVTATILVVFASTALARVASQPRSDSISVVASNPLVNNLEKRKGCTGDRVQGDVCKGNVLRAQNSFHNW